MFASHWIPRGVGWVRFPPLPPAPTPTLARFDAPAKHRTTGDGTDSKILHHPWPPLPLVLRPKGPEGGFRGRPGHPQQAADEDPPQVHEEDPQGEGGAHAAGQVLRLQPPPPLPQEGAGARRGPSPESRLTHHRQKPRGERREGMGESGGEARRWRQVEKGSPCGGCSKVSK